MKGFILFSLLIYLKGLIEKKKTDAREAIEEFKKVLESILMEKAENMEKWSERALEVIISGLILTNHGEFGNIICDIKYGSLSGRPDCKFTHGKYKFVMEYKFNKPIS